MGILALRLRNAAPASAPLRTGVALAVTAAVSYALCTLVWLAAPGAFLTFMNSLFHGLDFSPLLQRAPFSWVGSFEAGMVMTVWAFLAGSFFEWLRQRLGS